MGSKVSANGGGNESWRKPCMMNIVRMTRDELEIEPLYVA
jgi:hypothetical protein